jgi:hypothetical protein
MQFFFAIFVYGPSITYRDYQHLYGYRDVQHLYGYRDDQHLPIEVLIIYIPIEVLIISIPIEVLIISIPIEMLIISIPIEVLIISKKKNCIWNFYFSSNFNAAFFFELIGPRALVVCVLISKFELSYFTPNINAVFLQNDPPYGSLMDHKKLLFHFENRSSITHRDADHLYTHRDADHLYERC